MKSQNNIIRELQEIYQAEPGAELRDRILQSANTQTEPPRRVRRRMGLRTMLIAAVLVVLSISAAIAGRVPKIFKQFRHGQSYAIQADMIDNSDITSMSFGFKGGQSWGKRVRGEEVFYSLEEAQSHTTLDLRTPRFLPDDIDAFHVRIMTFADGTFDDSAAWISYNHSVHYYENGWNGTDGPIWGGGGPLEGKESFELEIRYAPGIYYELETRDPIYEISLNGIDAVVMVEGLTVEAKRTPEIKIIWIDGDVGFNLTGTYDLDTMIAIAESV